MFSNFDRTKRTNLVEIKRSAILNTDTSQEDEALIGSEISRKHSNTVGTVNAAMPPLQKSATETVFRPTVQTLDYPKSNAVTTINSAQTVKASATFIKSTDADQSRPSQITPARRIPMPHLIKQISDIKPLPPSRTTEAIRAAASSKIDTGPGRMKSKVSRNLPIRGSLDQRTTSVTSLSSVMTSGPYLGRFRSTSPGIFAAKQPNCQLGSVSRVKSISSLAISKGSDEKPKNALLRRVTENNQIKVFETCHRKMREVQSDFMKKSETMKGISPESLQKRYKFVAMVINDQSKLMVNDDDLLRLPKKLPATSVNDLKERVKFTIEAGLNILYEHLCNIQLSKDEYESRVQVAATRQKIEDLQDKKMEELLKQIDVMCKTSDGGGDAAMTRVLKDLQESRRNLQIAERKLLDIKKQHVEELAALDRNHKAMLWEEVNIREATLKEMTKQTNKISKDLEVQSMLLIEKEAITATIQDECSSHTTKIEELNAIIQKLQIQLKENEVKLSNERESIKHYVSQIQSFKNELKHARGLLEILQSQPLSDERLASKEVLISDLKKQVTVLEKYKITLEGQVNSMVMQCETIDILNKKLEQSETKINELQTKMERQTFQQSSNLNDTKTKESLNQKLIKSQDRILRLEEQSERDRQMLHVRADMITTLQNHEIEIRGKMEDLVFQLGEKNSLIDQINNELLTKTEEFRTLFNTLGAKQTELTRQCHIIKLLEENYERNQTLRVKQEERIAQQDDEIAHLKHTMDVYRRIMISNSGRNLFEPYTPAEMSDLKAKQHDPTCQLHKFHNANNEPQKPGST